MVNTARGYYNSPIGVMELTASGDTITGAFFIAPGDPLSPSSDSDIINKAMIELDEYFAGKRKEFTVNLYQPGSDFARHVWSTLIHIHYGGTVSYSGLAWLSGKPRAVRATASIVAKNNIAILIPCHRVTGKNSPGGYKWGMDKKDWLLQHELKFADK